MWCHCARSGVAFRTSSTPPPPRVTMTGSTRHHPQGLCPCPQSKPWAAQEGNPSLTAAEPPLQCQGREGAPPSRPPSWQRAVWASQECASGCTCGEQQTTSSSSATIPYLPSKTISKYINKDHTLVNQTLFSACLCSMIQQI